MKTILVGFDGSEPAVRAAQEAAKLAKETGATVRLACVVPPVWLPSADITGTLYTELHDSQRARGQAMLDEQTALLEKTGVTVEPMLGEGAPADELARLSEAPEVGMIAVGNASHRGLARVFLGSVSYRLLHLAKKPVLVVP
jgi:nucleotide-binding universal stress UspA family protein